MGSGRAEGPGNTGAPLHPTQLSPPNRYQYPHPLGIKTVLLHPGRGETRQQGGLPGLTPDKELFSFILSDRDFLTLKNQTDGLKSQPSRVLTSVEI